MKWLRRPERSDVSKAPVPGQINIGTTLNVVQGGDQHVHHYPTAAGFRLHPLVGASRENPTSLRGRPSQLLIARNQVVDFIGRQNELAYLQDWLAAPHRSAALLLHGGAGAGKTRLATEFAERSAREGWSVLVAQRADGPPPLLEVAGAANRLIIIDYAERWPRTDLLEILASSHAGTTRVLLLARSAKSWWNELRHPLREHGVHVDIAPLNDLASTTAGRQEVFAAACSSFARAYRTTAAGLEPAGVVNDSRYRSVLMIHMAALAAVDARASRCESPAVPGALSAYLLDREYAHWAALRDGHRVTSTTLTLTRAAFLATLVGPMSRTDGVRLLRRSGLARDDAAAEQILDDHRICSPPADDAQVLEPLAPDRLGEDFLSRSLNCGRSDEFADPWAVDVSARILTDGGALRPRAATVLAEAGKRWSHVRSHINASLRQVPHTLLDLGGAALLTVAEIADVPLLAAAAAVLPDRDAEFDAAAARITERLTAHRLEHTDDPVDRARLWAKLGKRLSNAHDYERASAQTQAAITQYRLLIEHGGHGFSPDLAAALHDSGTQFAGLGQADAALAATTEAAAIRESLADQRPDKYGPEFAASLDNLAVDLTQVGRFDAALRTAERAMTVHERLAQLSDQHADGLAASAHNLGVHLARAGQAARAVAMTERAVDLYKTLATRDPRRHEASLAAALHDLGVLAQQSGRPSRGAATASAAVGIRARLAERNPAAFTPDLLTSLRGVASALSESGAHRGAVRASRQAVALATGLAAAKPEAHDADAAAALHNHAICLARAGDRHAAVAAARQAVTIRERLTRTCLRGYEQTLNDCLRENGVILHSRMRLQGSNTSPSDDPIVRRLQRSFDAIWAENPAGGAHSRENLRVRLFRAGRITANLVTLIPAAAPVLSVPARDLDRCEASLARSLGNLSSRLAEADHRREALAAAEQAAESFLRLVSADNHHTTEFATALANLSLRLVDSGRPAQARDSARRAATVLDDRRGLDAVSILRVYSWVCRVTKGDLAAGLAAAVEARAICRELGRVEPQSFAAITRSVMELEASLLTDLGRDEESDAVRWSLASLPSRTLDQSA